MRSNVLDFIINYYIACRFLHENIKIFNILAGIQIYLNCCAVSGRRLTNQKSAFSQRGKSLQKCLLLIGQSCFANREKSIQFPALELKHSFIIYAYCTIFRSFFFFVTLFVSLNTLHVEPIITYLFRIQIKNICKKFFLIRLSLQMRYYTFYKIQTFIKACLFS